MIQHRLTERLAAHWNLLRKDNILPDFSQFNPSAITDIWQNCVLFTVQPTAAGTMPMLGFKAIGDKLSPLFGKELIGKIVNFSQKHFHGAAIIRRTGEVIENPAPLFDEGQFVTSNSKVVKFRSCLMPFGSKDGRITHIVVGLSWREF
jgi:hypothetical protein